MKINRLVIIDHTKEAEERQRSGIVVSIGPRDDLEITTDIQDEGRTLKVFIKNV